MKSADRALTPILIALALAGCGAAADEKQSSPPQREKATATPQPKLTDERALPKRPSPQPPGDAQGEGASQVLKAYFSFIENAEFDKAWQLRWEAQTGGASRAESFRDSFRAYSEYHANIGTPGEVAEAGGTSFIEVPVQLYGRLQDGKPFSTAGTVSLRKKGRSGWRIYSRD